VTQVWNKDAKPSGLIPVDSPIPLYEHWIPEVQCTLKLKAFRICLNNMYFPTCARINTHTCCIRHESY